MNGRAWLIGVVLLVLPGCFYDTRSLAYTNASISDLRQGRDCKVLFFGLTQVPDLTVAQAIRLGGITKLRSAEYQMSMFHGVGNECVVAHGE
ncbi:MAG TPA: hypothetical protein VJ805_03315 [Nitrospiraceae bacterium]|nr:hypothetical protein [Nitrospiraceae bacterium]